MPVTYLVTLATLVLDGTPVVLMSTDRPRAGLPVLAFEMRAAPGVRGLRRRVAAHLVLLQEGDGYRLISAYYRFVPGKHGRLGQRQRAWGEALQHRLVAWVCCWLTRAGWQSCQEPQADAGQVPSRWVPGPSSAPEATRTRQKPVARS